MKVDEPKLLRDTATILRRRISAQRAQIEAQAEEARALGQEIDLFADAVDKLIRRQHDLELALAARTEAEERAVQERDDARAEVARLRAQLATIDAVAGE